jgi:hypothetical protein
MKKVLVLVAVVISASFASCKKDYACKCTFGGQSVTGATFKETKKKAEDACTANAGTYAAVGGSCEAVKM